MIEGRRTTGRETIGDSRWAKDFGRWAKDDDGGRWAMACGRWVVSETRLAVGGEGR